MTGIDWQRALDAFCKTTPNGELYRNLVYRAAREVKVGNLNFDNVQTTPILFADSSTGGKIWTVVTIKPVGSAAVVVRVYGSLANAAKGKGLNALADMPHTTNPPAYALTLMSEKLNQGHGYTRYLESFNAAATLATLQRAKPLPTPPPSANLAPTKVTSGSLSPTPATGQTIPAPLVTMSDGTKIFDEKDLPSFVPLEVDTDEGEFHPEDYGYTSL